MSDFEREPKLSREEVIKKYQLSEADIERTRTMTAGDEVSVYRGFFEVQADIIHTERLAAEAEANINEAANTPSTETMCVQAQDSLALQLDAARTQYIGFQAGSIIVQPDTVVLN